MRNFKYKKLFCLVLSIIAYVGVISCSLRSDNMDETKESKKSAIKLVALKGPTSLGLVELWDKSDEGANENKYDINVVGEPAEAIAKLASGDADVGLVPTNMASILYNKTSGNVKLAAINALGGLYIVSNNKDIKEVRNLKGRKIYVSGQGATPEYALRYVLQKNDLEVGRDVFLEYNKAEHSELASQVISEDVDIALLPEPFVTQVTEKNSNIKVALNLTKEWDRSSESKDNLTMGCIIVRKNLIEDKKDSFDRFLDDYKNSVEYVDTNLEGASQLADKYGIMQKEIAIKALPKCNIVFIEGEEMKNKVINFLKVLFDFEPKSIGGKMPSEDFYYKR
ncbi:MAG: ABC transporter substrate-binding protein [Clostridia bacterium]|nr:ABC transporter substrate-binding protein [Clostridia bacterium]